MKSKNRTKDNNEDREEKNDFKLNVYNRLFFKVFLYYGIMLVVFAVLIGSIFMKLYEESSMKTYRIQLQTRAVNIASVFTDCVENEDNAAYSSYIEMLDVIESSDIWIISNPKSKNPMSLKMESNVDLTDVDLMKAKEKVLVKTFLGQVNYNVGYFDIYDTVMITIGAPIYDVDKGVVGAVLLNAPIEKQTEIIKSSQYLIVISSLLALVISFFIAIIFARRLSSPISKMRVTALNLAEGKYNLKMNIKQKDEIGDLANAIDILAVKLYENEEGRKSLEQMRQDFFANISHELRTPITVVRAYTEMLVDKVVTDETKIYQYYGRILSECKGMERLVGDLLILSKMQNPDFHIQKEPINISQVFSDIIRSVKVIGEKKNIIFEFTKDDGNLMMFGDYDRIRQMFMIILDNAIKFSKENSKIYINILKMDKLVVSVEDEGAGISEEDLPNIFDKFYKSKLKANANGTGLGLAIAREIALKHSGEIKVNSQIGKGTKFIFYFDLLDIE